MQTFLAELIGTMILVLLGDGVVANVLLARSKGQNSGWIVITVGWGVAVAIAVYAVGRISGAHLNPAVTIGLASMGSFPWANVPGYIAAQLIGAFVGAILVWLAYLPHWRETADPGAKLGVFCTGPAIASTGCQLHHRNDRDRDARVWCAGDRRERAGVHPAGGGRSVDGVQPRPATAAGRSSRPRPWRVARRSDGLRDQSGARLRAPAGARAAAHPGKGGSGWDYAWIPIVGPIVGRSARGRALRGGGFLNVLVRIPVLVLENHEPWNTRT